LLEAKSKMPTFYSSADFFLIMLHGWRARPISPVTTHERVGRTMSFTPRSMEIAMTTNSNQRSATIYQFPAGGRAVLGKARATEVKAVADPAWSNLSEAVYSGAWYHEAAIQESRQAREH
jgi:Protein of unknown function (DUF2735)